MSGSPTGAQAVPPANTGLPAAGVPPVATATHPPPPQAPLPPAPPPLSSSSSVSHVRSMMDSRKIALLGPMFHASLLDASLHIHPTRTNEFVTMVDTATNLDRLRTPGYLLIPVFTSVVRSPTVQGQLDTVSFINRPGIVRTPLTAAGTRVYLSLPDFDKLNWVSVRVLSCVETAPHVTVTFRVVEMSGALNPVVGTTFLHPEISICPADIDSGREFTIEYVYTSIFLPTDDFLLPAIPLAKPQELETRTQKEITNSKITPDGTHTIVNSSATTFLADVAASLPLRRMLGNSPRYDAFVGRHHGHLIDDTLIRSKLDHASRSNASTGLFAGRNMLDRIVDCPVWTDLALFSKLLRLDFRVESPYLSMASFINPKVHPKYDRSTNLEILISALNGFSIAAEVIFGPPFRDWLRTVTDHLMDATMNADYPPELIYLQVDIVFQRFSEIMMMEGAPPNGDTRARRFFVNNTNVTSQSVSLLLELFTQHFSEEALTHARLIQPILMKRTWGTSPPGDALKPAIKKPKVEFAGAGSESPARTSRTSSPVASPAGRASPPSPAASLRPLVPPGKPVVCFKQLRFDLKGAKGPCQHGRDCRNFHQNLSVISRKDLLKKINAFVEPNASSNLKDPMLALARAAPASLFKHA